MTRILKTARAKDDLEALWLYIAKDRPDAADKMLDRIAETLRKLSLHPDMGRPRPELYAELRSFPIRPYVLYYRPVEQGIEVVRVLNAARDMPAAFEA
jgi:toxin ParE1/3/4